MILWLWACAGGDGDVPAAPDPSTTPSTLSTGLDTGLDTGHGTGTSRPTAATADTGELPDPCAEGELAYQPGVGPYVVYPVADGDDLTVVQGPQGGYHVDVAGVVAPVTDMGLIVRPLLSLADGTIVAGEGDVIQVGFGVYDPPTCEGSFADARMFVLSDAASLCAIDGRPAVYRVEVETFDGRSTVVERAVTLRIDLLDPYTCDDLP